MRHSLATAPIEPQRTIGDVRPQMLKADVTDRDDLEFRAEIAKCLDFARRYVGWSVEELADKLQKRDRAQVSRWLSGKDRLQLDSVFAVRELQWPFIVALSRLAKCEIETNIRMGIK